MSNDNPWFRRVWIIQVLSVSADYTFMCGKWSVPGDHFKVFNASFHFSFLWMKHEVFSLSSITQVDQYLDSHPNLCHSGGDWAAQRMGIYENVLGPALNIRACATLETRKTWRRDRPEDCPTLKAQLFRASAKRSASGLYPTDPRDRTYGLLGVASDAKELGMDPKSYTVYKGANTEEIVYTEVPRILVQHGHLDILTKCQPLDPRTRNAKLPSWAPDRKNEIPWPWGGFIGDDLYHASGKSSSRLVCCSEDPEGILTIKAMFIGKVAELGTTWKGGWREDFDKERASLLFTEIIGFLPKSTIFNKLGKADKVLWRIPIGGMVWNKLGINRRATEKSLGECQVMMSFFF